MRLLRRRGAIPPVLAQVLAPEERILAGARVVDGRLLAATRHGLLLTDGEQVTRWAWHLISRARLSAGALQVTVGQQLAVWFGDITVLVDDPPRDLPLGHATRLTDIVHERVRRSVAASRRVDWPGAGGWVTLRRVAGRDGLVAQVRLDPGADAEADGFASAVAFTVGEIWPEGVPRPGASGE